MHLAPENEAVLLQGHVWDVSAPGGIMGPWLPDVGGEVVDVQFHALCRDPRVITVGVSGRT